MTTHLVLNGEIITQAPSLKGANIFLGPSTEGSLKIPAFIQVSAALYAAGTLPQDNPIGHLIYSAYDYVVSQSLGFNVNYEESLGVTYQKMQENAENNVPILDESRFDSLIEKCESAILDIHRPIVSSGTAEQATIFFASRQGSLPLTGGLDSESFAFLHETKRDNAPSHIYGKISSYNINTYKGRVFCQIENRPIPFELAESIRTRKVIRLITSSLSRNAIDRDSDDADLILNVLRNTSKSGRLKSYYVVEVIKKV